MAKSFGFIFWGLILVVLDFKINGFDLLPDAIGYVLVGIGAATLHWLSPKFSLAGSLSLFLAISWLVGLMVAGEAATVFGILVTAINCAMIWSLLGGIIDFAKSKERYDLAEKAHHRRIGYVAVMCGVLLLGLLAGKLGGIAAMLAVVAVIAGLVIMLLILHLIHRVRYELAASLGEVGEQA